MPERAASRTSIGCSSAATMCWPKTTRPSATHLAAQVTDWTPDPHDAARQIGLVPVPADDYHAGHYQRTITRVAVRCQLANGQWGIAVVICTLPAADALPLAGLDSALAVDPQASALAYVTRYDQRGGGVETTFKEDKQGLGVTKRSKNRLAAQQVVVAFGVLAHNVLVWAKRWLQPHVQGITRFGVKRLVRAVFGIGGLVQLDARGQVSGLVLNQANRLSRWLLTGLAVLASSAKVTSSLGETYARLHADRAGVLQDQGHSAGTGGPHQGGAPGSGPPGH